MAESAQDQALGILAGSTPGITKEQPQAGDNAKATKWANAPGVVGEDEGKKDEKSEGEDEHSFKAFSSHVDEAEPQSSERRPFDLGEPQSAVVNQPSAPSDEDRSNTSVRHGSEDEPQLAQNVTEAAGNVRDASEHERAEFAPARTAEHPLAGSAEETPEYPRLPESPGLDHPMFSAGKTLGVGRGDEPAPDDSDEANEPEPDAQDTREEELDRWEEELHNREAEINRRERAAQPQSGTVSDQDVDSQIVGENYIRGIDAFKDAPNLSDADKAALGSLTIGVLSLRNGGVVVGTSESDSADNYDPNKGREGARADARSQLDAMHRYAHRMKVAGI